MQTATKKSAYIGEIFGNRDSVAQAASGTTLRRYMSLGDPNKDFRFDRFAKLNQMNSEKQQLLTKLNEYQQKIDSLSNFFVGASRNVAEAPLHLAFMFATPLVIRKTGYKGGG